MEGKLSREAKGKNVVSEPSQPPRKGRIRAQVPDVTELNRKLSLTLVGRITNHSAQKIWSLVPYFTEHWKAMGRPVGSDLGNGQFQFQFENEEDLLAVLEKRPYRFAKWMIILQRWEPTVNSSFPSLIPFWIKVQGIPLHLWKEETIKSLGEDIGIYEKAEISDFSIRMRVQINGLLPLIKTSIIEYPNGDEVTASFVYERLEKHCSKCLRLDHEFKDCLVAKHEARALRQKQHEPKESSMDNNMAIGDYRPNHYQFSASREKRPESRSHQSPDYHRDSYHDARHAIAARRRDRSSQKSYSRRPYKEPPRDWRRSNDNGHSRRRETSPFHDDSYNRR